MKSAKEPLYLTIQMKKLIISSLHDLQGQTIIFVTMSIFHSQHITSQKCDDGTWLPKAKNAIPSVSKLQEIGTDDQMQSQIHFQMLIDS